MIRLGCASQEQQAVQNPIYNPCFSKGIATSNSWSQRLPSSCFTAIPLPVLRWPKAFESTISRSSVVLLDMETFSIACMVGGPQWGRYIMSIAVFPLGAVWLLVCFTSSRQFKAKVGLGFSPEGLSKGSSNSGGLFHIFISSHLHIYLHIIFTSSYRLHVPSSHLYIYTYRFHTYTCSHVHIASSHRHIYTYHLHIYTHPHLHKSS